MKLKKNRWWTGIAALLMAVNMEAAEWKTYLSCHNATKNTPVAGRVYSLASGDLYYYVSDEKEAHVLSKTTGLSDVAIRHCAYNNTLSTFLLVYANSNIDVLGQGDSVVGMPEFKNSNLQDKTVNGISMAGKYAYLATNSGVVVVNMESCEFTNTYSFGQQVRACACVDGRIYAATAVGVYVGELKKNLLDQSNWKILTTAGLSSLFEYGGDLYCIISRGLYTMNPTSGALGEVRSGAFTYANTEGDLLVLGSRTAITTMDEARNFSEYPIDNDFLWSSYDGKDFWVSHGYNGLKCLHVTEEKGLQWDSVTIIPDSPVRNDCYYLGFTEGQRLLVGGGRLNYQGIVYDGTVMYFENGKWTNFSEDSITLQTGLPYRNITSVAQDPADPNHHYASSAAGGLYEYRNGRFIHLYDCDNSPLTSILPSDVYYRNATRVAGLNFDDEGNLWMLNNQVDTIVRVLKNDGQWTAFRIPSVAGYPTFDKLYFDSRGTIWITHRRTTSEHHAGLLAFDYNGTLNNKADDRSKFLYTFVNQDNTSYTFNQVYDVVEDLEGALWVATNQGPFVLRDPSAFFDGTPVMEQVVVNRNDGTNYADYLLLGVPITAIAVDGGNRKWFGTDGNGVYLISADGQTTVHHFTKENSPLLSNVIYSIAVNGTTGEVFFGTDAGLVSFRSDATDPATMLESDNLKVYPNPIRPGYEGKVTVTGFTANSDVKVTTATGQLVAQGQSVGGTFTWNLRTKAGHRAGSGIYYIIGSDAQGNKGATAKLLIVK